MQNGPDRLRLAAQRRQKLIQGAQEWAQKGNDPNIPTMDQMLVEIAEEKAKKAAEGDDDDDDFMIGSRELPPELPERPGIDTDLDEEGSDAIDEAEAETADDEEAIATEEEKGEGDAQPAEVDEFFQGAVRMTAQLVVGLHQGSITPEKRAELVGIVLELTRKIIQFRGLLA